MVVFNIYRYIAKTRSPLAFSKKALFLLSTRSLSSQRSSFKFSDLEIDLVNPSEKKPIPDAKSMVGKFGKYFSDHMLKVEWTKADGWGKPCISKLQNFSIHPAAKVLHYAQELFEGMKAFRSDDGNILLFRPLLNMDRLLLSAERASLPSFDRHEFLNCIKKLISIDKDWVPGHESSALYIRPTFIGIEDSLGVAASNRALLYVITSPVGPYFKSEATKPVDLLADPNFVRSWPGGIGNRKMGANYAVSLYVQALAEKQGLHQVLWLNGKEHELAEVGAMNIFVYIINSYGEKELITPPLDGTILPGIVRRSLLEIATDWNEFKVSERPFTMKELIATNKEKKLLEIFGSGTACIVCPVGSITYMGEKIDIPTRQSNESLTLRFLKHLQGIQYGRIPHEWSVNVD